MFISNDEKRYLFDQVKLLTTLSEKVEKLESQVIFWQAKVRASEGKVDTLFQITSVKPKPKKVQTPEQKARQKVYSRRYYEKKKAEKALEKK